MVLSYGQIPGGENGGFENIAQVTKVFWQQAQVDTVVVAATSEQQRTTELTRARAELTATVTTLENNDVYIRRLSARIHP